MLNHHVTVRLAEPVGPKGMERDVVGVLTRHNEAGVTIYVGSGINSRTYFFPMRVVDRIDIDVPAR